MKLELEQYQKIVRKQRDNITLVMKVTNKCHLNCKYCYHLHNATEDLNADMDINLFKESILKICPPFKSVNLHIHGGEPLTLPVETLEEIFKFVDNYREAVKDYQKVYPAIQTNLTLLTDEKKALLEKYSIQLSTSFDGYYNKETRNLDVEKSIDRLNNVDLPNKGVINVVTRETCGHFEEQMEIFDKIKNTTVMSNPVFPFCCPDESKLEPGQYADYVIKRFEYQLENDKNFSWDTLRYLSSVVNEGVGCDCFCSYCLNSIFTISPSGRIRGCDVRYEDIFFYGNIRDINNFNDIYNLEGYQKFEKATLEHVNRCSDCEYYKYCKGACFNRSVVINNDIISKDYYCYDIKLIIQYFIDFFKEYDNDPSKLPKRLQNLNRGLMKALNDSTHYDKEKRRTKNV